MRHDITLTIGLFFDGTGNNETNTMAILNAFSAEGHALNTPKAEAHLIACAQKCFNVSGIRAVSYTGYYTNIHWLKTYYRCDTAGEDIQHAVYIEGPGTEAGRPDSPIGLGLGISGTGIVARVEQMVAGLPTHIRQALDGIRKTQPETTFTVSRLQFDIFGFSRGAAAARDFANRVQSEDEQIISSIRRGMADVDYRGAPAGKIRFAGLFDTVAATGTPENGLNPHSANAGGLKLALRPGVADEVFHLTAAHECRFNFVLNSIKPDWPELALPGVHADIGGGYLPVMTENLFLTRPETDTVPLDLPGERTRGYRRLAAQRTALATSPCMAPLLRSVDVLAETWYDDRMPVDRYGQMQKRSYSALTMRGRTVRNDWSRVALRVMLEAAREAGVAFDDAGLASDPAVALSAELMPLCEKALAMGRAVRRGRLPEAFSQDELDTIAKKYIHCSANWNTIETDPDGRILGGALPSALTGFVNRPDEQWVRTRYDMDGRRVQQ